jgi:hypothetical protein
MINLFKDTYLLGLYEFDFNQYIGIHSIYKLPKNFDFFW